MINVTILDDICSELFQIRFNEANIHYTWLEQMKTEPTLDKDGNVNGSRYVMGHRDLMEMTKEMAWEDLPSREN